MCKLRKLRVYGREGGEKGIGAEKKKGKRSTRRVQLIHSLKSSLWFQDGGDESCKRAEKINDNERETKRLSPSPIFGITNTDQAGWMYSSTVVVAVTCGFSAGSRPQEGGLLDKFGRCW